jgi:regulator of sigma D
MTESKHTMEETGLHASLVDIIEAGPFPIFREVNGDMEVFAKKKSGIKEALKTWGELLAEQTEKVNEAMVKLAKEEAILEGKDADEVKLSEDQIWRYRRDLAPELEKNKHKHHEVSKKFRDLWEA